MRWTLIFLCYMFQGFVKSVKILDFRIPDHAVEGGEALLGCQFDMEGEVLYSIKWYKDNREFFRYVPKNEPMSISFQTRGVNVDMSRSAREDLTLVNLTQESAGVYRCEVSGEAPSFKTAYNERFIDIYLLPNREPLLLGLKKTYKIGDRALVNCTSAASKPMTSLRWWINNVPAPKKYLRGPWVRIPDDRPDATETILQIDFRVSSKHFRNGVMKLKCQALIAPMYQQESSQILSQYQPQIPPVILDQEESEEMPNFNIHTFLSNRQEELSEIPDSSTASITSTSPICIVIIFIIRLF